MSVEESSFVTVRHLAALQIESGSQRGETLGNGEASFGASKPNASADAANAASASKKESLGEDIWRPRQPKNEEKESICLPIGGRGGTEGSAVIVVTVVATTGIALQ